MLAFLRGKILNKGKGCVILQTGDIGYQIFVNVVAYADLSIGQEIEFYLYHHVREDMEDLYGFKNFAELEKLSDMLSSDDFELIEFIKKIEKQHEKIKEAMR